MDKLEHQFGVFYKYKSFYLRITEKEHGDVNLVIEFIEKLLEDDILNHIMNNSLGMLIRCLNIISFGKKTYTGCVIDIYDLFDGKEWGFESICNDESVLYINFNRDRNHIILRFNDITKIIKRCPEHYPIGDYKAYDTCMCDILVKDLMIPKLVKSARKV